MKDKSRANTIVSEDGSEVYYWVNWNKGLTKNFVVLHPGASMTHSSLQNLEQGLNKEGFPTIVLEPRGFGRSNAPSEPEYFKLEKYSKDLSMIVEKESLDKPLFVSHSFGFMPVIDYVAQTSNASYITGICASHNFSKTTPNKVLFHFFNRILRYVEYPASLLTQANHWLKGEKRVYPPDQSKLVGESDFSVWLSIVDAPLEKIRVHTTSGVEITKWDISSQLEKVTAPMLLIYGSDDWLVTPRAGDYISSLHCGQTNIEIIKGSHSLPITKPDSVLDVMSKYLF